MIRFCIRQAPTQFRLSQYYEQQLAKLQLAKLQLAKLQLAKRSKARQAISTGNLQSPLPSKASFASLKPLKKQRNLQVPQIGPRDGMVSRLEIGLTSLRHRQLWPLWEIQIWLRAHRMSTFDHTEYCDNGR